MNPSPFWTPSGSSTKEVQLRSEAGGDERVLVFSLEGDFEVPARKLHSADSIIRADHLSVTIDPATRRILDLGATDEPAPIARLGTPAVAGDF